MNNIYDTRKLLSSSKLKLETVTWSIAVGFTFLALFFPPARYIAYLIPFLALFHGLAEGYFRVPDICKPLVLLVLTGICLSPLASNDGLKDLFFICSGISIFLVLKHTRFNPYYLFGLFIFGTVLVAFTYNGLNKGFVFVDIPSNIMFKSGTATLNKKSIEMLGGIARLLEAQPEINFLIEGHTDNKTFKANNNNDNWTLSVNRATAVAKVLQTKYKIDPKRIIAAGRSQYLPVADNNTKQGRLNNRRIRIVLMPSVKQIMNLHN